MMKLDWYQRSAFENHEQLRPSSLHVHANSFGEEKRRNPRFVGKTREEFIRLMDSLDLPKPHLIDVAVPANQRLGLDVQQG